MDLGRSVLVTNVADFEDIEVKDVEVTASVVTAATDKVALLAVRETVTV